MKRFRKKATSLVLALTMVVTLCPQTQLIDVLAEENNEPYCISVGRPVYASSQNGGEKPENAVDGDEGTRWQAAQDDKNEWFYVDLGKEANITGYHILWENSYAKSYVIQISNDEENWDTIYTVGKGIITEETEPEETESQAMTVTKGKIESANSTQTDKNGNVYTKKIELKWSKVSGATNYDIVMDGETQAIAEDGYPFGGKWGDRDFAPVLVPDDGEDHIYTVYAYDENDNVIISATISVNATVDAEEPTTEAPTEGETGPVVDPKDQTVEFETPYKARYVRIVCTERQLDYGCSFYEFQIYGTDGKVQRPADYGENLALNKEVTAKYNDVIQDGQVVRSVNVRDEWWMYDSDGNLMENAYDNVKPENAVDGNSNTTWTSYQGDDQWMYVDLGKEYTVGRVVLNWNADAGKIYDVQVSSDAKNWKTVHRVLRGSAYNKDNFTMYQENVRYVRMFGYTKVEHGSGFGVSDFEVYEYREGDSKENETIAALPQREIINSPNGKGTYVSGEMYNEKNKLPTFVNPDTIKTPIDSNSWWSSAMIQVYSNSLCSTPLKTGFSKEGLGVLTATAGWVGERTETDLGTDQSTETGKDFYIIPEDFEASSGYDRVEGYGDYSVKLGLMDDNGLQMTSTVVKGSPYIFSEFSDNTVAYISSTTITELFDGNGNAILANKGDVLTTDHIGFKSVDAENEKAKNDGAYYCVNVPEGTTFKVLVAGSNYKIRVTFPSATDNYMSVAAMTKKDDINDYYQHGYAFVTDTHVGYSYNHDNSQIITTYTATTELKRSGFSNETMHCMFPHQWKHSSDADNPYTTYPSIRGDMKSIWANEYTTTQQFSGLLPTFAKPDSDMFNNEEMIDYLNQVVASKVNTAPVSDAYWEGKNVHPLAISAIMADQLGETEIKEKLLAKLKSIMIDWFNYDGEGDRCYLIYNKDWGTVYYPDSAYGANAAICDHHFTYGYFMFGAAVLATYDKEFYNDYKDMVEILVRDYADPLEPEDDGNMFCKFRSFDQYSGHSWAGGYADSDSGNNQESASEALFSWVGMYLWGEATQNDKWIDAGAYGFTTEMDAIEQYWFDYDETNWLGDHPDRPADQAYDYPFQGVGQIYGASMGYGTFFGGQPLYVYGIQWLPISEYLTNYGMNQEKCAKIYQGLWDDTNYAINIEKKIYAGLLEEAENLTGEGNQLVDDGATLKIEGDQLKAEADKLQDEGKQEEAEAKYKEAEAKYEEAVAKQTEAEGKYAEAEAKIKEADEWHNWENYATPDSGWQHITWPFLSQTDAKGAYDVFEKNVTKVQTEDRANTLWFIASMDAYGYRTNDYMVVGNIQGSVYKKDTKDKGGNVTATKYTAQVWNPTETTQTVTIKKADGTVVGTAAVGSKATVAFEIEDSNFELNQAATPVIKATSVADGTVKENLSGTVKFEDTQIVELSTEDEGATIYYTTDGSTPTAKSPKYEGSFIVSSNTTVKAIAIGDKYINSAYASTLIKIDGDKVQGDDNLALKKKVSASSTDGDKKTENAVDGNEGTMWQAKSEDADVVDFDADKQWFEVDLGSVQVVNTVKILWEAAYAEKYEIQVSTDGENWETVAKESGMAGWMETNFAAVNARYVRMQGVQRGTQYGYGIKEFEVYGAEKAKAPTVLPESGTYEEAQTVTMSTEVKGAEIKYTLDGSKPTEESLTYTGPLTVSKSTIVKAATYRKGMTLSDVVTTEIVIAGTISLDKTEAKVAIGRTLQINAVTDRSVTWTSSNNDIAIVENGLVTAKAVGKVTITATIPNGEKAECIIDVIEAIPITSIEMSKKTLTMKNLTTDKLTATIAPADTTDDTTITWSSSNENIVTVDENGKLTAKSEGEVVITATVGEHTAECTVKVGPAATIDEMIESQKYNLALGKDVNPSGVMPDGEGTTKDKITDGYLSTAHCAVTAKDDSWSEGDSSYVVIDLGKYYKAETIDQVLVAYKNSESNDSVVGHSYSVAFSKGGYEYDTVVDNRSITTADDLDDTELYATIDTVTATGYVRYVKISYPAGPQFGMQVKEIAVLDKDCNAETIEIQMIDNPADFTVTADKLSEITYTITAGEGQEDFKYNVYMNGEKIAENVGAGTHEIKDVKAGIYELRVISVYGESFSDGIVKTVEVDDGTYTRLLNTDRNIALNGTVTVDPMADNNEGSKDTSILVDSKISNANADTVQTIWDNTQKEAMITLKLKHTYKAEDIEAVLMAFKAENTSATAYTVEFSSDGENYETVADVTGKEYAESYEDLVDTSSYTQDTVKYVRFNIKDGNNNWGYQISEIAVFTSKTAEPVKEEIIISNDIAITGFQMTTSLGGVIDTVGIRTIYQRESVVEGQEVKEFGLVYALDTGEVVDTDMTCDSSNYYVAHSAATEDGKYNVKMGEAQTAEYYVMTMPTGNTAEAYNQNYKVRPYAVLDDGTVVYGTVTSYNIFNIAKQLYDNKKMPTGIAHSALYKVLKAVDSNYVEVEYEWNNTLVNKPDSTMGEINVIGFQMTNALGGEDDTLGLRVIYSVDGNIKENANEVGLIYGLVYNNNGITADSMTLENASDTNNQYVLSYAATEQGLMDVTFGTSTSATYYARTMNISNLNKTGYTVTYLLRAYAKDADGNVTYSDVCSYIINDVASNLYDNALMSSYKGHEALYNKILKKVNPDYKEAEYNWNKTIVE